MEAKIKKALCVGINNYPGTANDLQGCVNDANDWSALLSSLGFATSLMLDSQATLQNVKAGLSSLVVSAGEGDVIVFTYSGHGTQAIDVSGDEGDNLRDRPFEWIWATVHWRFERFRNQAQIRMVSAMRQVSACK